MRSPKGFTLLEVMVSMLLLVGGIASASFVFSRGIFATSDAEQLQIGTALAQERMENLRATGFSAIVNEPKAAVPGWAGFSRQVTVTQPAGTNSDFKQVVVTVYWNTVGGEISTSLTTYIAQVANN